MRTAWPQSEEVLAAEVVRYVNGCGWETFHEVNGHTGRVDIVGRKGNLIWAIECKLTLSMALTDQAYRHLGHANYVSVAVPNLRFSGGMEKYLAFLGIGALFVGEPWAIKEKRSYNHIIERLTPRFYRRRTDLISHWLRDEYKDCAAGSVTPGWTPFKGTCHNAVDYVHNHGGRVLYKEMIKGIEHHYSSPRAAIQSFHDHIDAGRVGNLMLEKAADGLWVKEQS